MIKVGMYKGVIYCNEDIPKECNNMVTISEEDFNFGICSEDFDNEIFNLNKYNIRKLLFLNKKEIKELEEWFVSYDRVCNEHARCQRLGIECHHNINEWDIQAVEKAERLKILRG